MRFKFNDLKPCFQYAVCVGGEPDYYLYFTFMSALKTAHALSDALKKEVVIFENEKVCTDMTDYWCVKQVFAFSDGKLRIETNDQQINTYRFCENGHWLNRAEYQRDKAQFFKKPVFFGRYII